MTGTIAEDSYNRLLYSLSSTSVDKRRKFELIINSRGILSAEQTVRLLQSFKDSADKVRAIRLLEKRLERMTCQEASQILCGFSLCGNDRLAALEVLKRHLIDHQSTTGIEYLLYAFDNEADKLRALAIAQTVSHFVSDRQAAGGHQGYSAVGGLHTQNWPLDQHLYGSLEEQTARLPGRGSQSLPVHAQPGRLNSLYNSQASFAYPADRSCYQSRPYMSAVPAPDEC